MSERRTLCWIVVGLAGLALGLGVWLWRLPALFGTAGTPAPASVRRIVSLTLATDEILAELVPPDRLVGVTYLADDPGISNVPQRHPEAIARLRETDLERIIALAPDLVCVASYSSADVLQLLERSGIRTYRHDGVNSMAEVADGIRKLGEQVGEPDEAERMIQRLQARRADLARRLANVTHRPRVLFWSAGFTAGRKTTIDDAIREAGAINVAAELGLEGSVEISPERVITADPDVILLAQWTADERQMRIDLHPILGQLRAVREKRVMAIEGRYLLSVSQFVVTGAERLARHLHPDRFGTEVAP